MEYFAYIPKTNDFSSELFLILKLEVGQIPSTGCYLWLDNNPGKILEIVDISKMDEKEKMEIVQAKENIEYQGKIYLATGKAIRCCNCDYLLPVYVI